MIRYDTLAWSDMPTGDQLKLQPLRK